MPLPRAWGLGAPVSGVPPQGRNHLELRPARGGGRALVKRSPVPADGLAREAQVLAALEGRSLGFDRPRVLGHAPALGAIALRWVPRAPSLYALHTGARALPFALAKSLGAALATLHASSPDGLPPTSAPGELLRCFVWPTVPWYAALNPASVTLLSRVQRAPGTTDAMIALFDAANGAHGVAPVHGDFRHPNLLRANGRWLFVDWEMAGTSDPASDVGSAIGEVVNAWIAPRSAAEALTQAAVKRWLTAFWKGYARGDAAFATRAVRWAGEALLRRAYSESHYEAKFDARTEQVLAAAIALLAKPGAWVRPLLGVRR